MIKINSLSNLHHLKHLRCLSQFIKLNKNNYFDVFKLKNEFVINEEQLAKQFKSMQMVYHPDKTANLDQDSKEIADHNSSLVNRAYQTLKDPYKRGLHLLNLNDLSISEDESSTNLTSDFLVKLMDLNEQINEKRDSNDELKKMLDEIEKEKIHLLELIEQNFKNENYQDAKNCLIQFNFYDNITKKIVDILE